MGAAIVYPQVMIDKASVRVYYGEMKNKSAVALGKKTSLRKKKTSAENGKKIDEIRARLTIYGHADMNENEFSFFKKWITTIVPDTAKHKRGELSKIFRQTLYKHNQSL